MTPEIRQSIIDELSDLMNRRVGKLNDIHILQAEKQCFPYEKVMEIYNYYKIHGMINTAKYYKMSKGWVSKRFKYYNLPMDYKQSRNYSENRHKQTFTPTQKHLDTLSMTYSEWNLKYQSTNNGISKGAYYQCKKTMQWHLELSE